MKYRKKNTKKRLTINNTSCIIIFALLKVRNFILIMNSEKYSRGRRGAPAKGVGR